MALAFLGIGTEFPPLLQILFDSEKTEQGDSIRAEFEKLGQRMRKRQIDTIYGSKPLVRTYYQARRALGRAMKLLGLRGLFLRLHFLA